MSSKKLPKRIKFNDIASVEGLRLWISNALKDHYKDREVPDVDVTIIFPKVKELVMRELWEEDNFKIRERWTKELVLLEERIKKVKPKI